MSALDAASTSSPEGIAMLRSLTALFLASVLVTMALGIGIMIRRGRRSRAIGHWLVGERFLWASRPSR